MTGWVASFWRRTHCFWRFLWAACGYTLSGTVWREDRTGQPLRRILDQAWEIRYFFTSYNPVQCPLLLQTLRIWAISFSWLLLWEPISSNDFLREPAWDILIFSVVRWSLFRFSSDFFHPFDLIGFYYSPLPGTGRKYLNHRLSTYEKVNAFISSKSVGTEWWGHNT